MACAGTDGGATEDVPEIGLAEWFGVANGEGLIGESKFEWREFSEMLPFGDRGSGVLLELLFLVLLDLLPAAEAAFP